ncbi:MAG TPA: hypothetical protein VNT79_05035 [Phycisphaerae bacterium]|nr:hypothetical protein [Phycisphaerae bacterium]
MNANFEITETDTMNIAMITKMFRVWPTTCLSTLVCACIGDAPVRTVSNDSASASCEKTEQSKSEYPMTVLLVRSERIAGAAFPIDSRRVLTAAHVIGGVPAAIVNQLPMAVPTKYRRRLRSAGRAIQDDWVRLDGTIRRFKPDQIDGSLPIAPGDKVLVGGFFLAGTCLSSDNFWKKEPNFVEGTALDPSAFDELPPNMVYIEVKDRDYRGFSGGPAGKRNQDGHVTVFGIAVVIHPTEKEIINDEGESIITDITVLGIRRISSEFR